MDEDDFLERTVMMHDFYGGKFTTSFKVPLDKENLQEYSSIWYTPGVAEPCRKIKKDERKVYDYTNKGNMVAVVSDGTRVLGLGDIGPKASYPVMEGKSLFFKYLGGVDAVPLPIAEQDEEKIVELVEKIEPGFGGINLEDIEKPKCFRVLDKLKEKLEIPVWHDDQQGTALVSLAGLFSALKLVDKNISEIKLVIGGAGAAGINNAKYAIKGGADPSNVRIVDSKGILSPDREDVKGTYKEKWAKKTNPQGERGNMKEALKGADACISATVPGPGTIKKEEVENMAEDAILFAEANPTPEISPEKAKEAGIRIIGTGRSDYSNQINNSIGFPGVFRGVLEVKATDITDKMCIAAAKAISERTEEIGLQDDFIIPGMDDKETYVKEAVAVGMQAIKEGVARKEYTRSELRGKVEEKINEPKKLMKTLRKNNLIKDSSIKDE
ncbi:MAG: Malic enzyme SfcA [Candidatus Methanohalarchaeum thermophilum]|uniref:Malic enzyme SfcA n=1 Tax=Methanohalarchaeum thermophilum TaxID=1903181 RepID=A0A1Q6DSB8_METT1|nr:MAG: Malic enzyme SfcA [Candidatus Methanohalarchaeum thermophilum]